jgi:hypothetical protein
MTTQLCVACGLLLIIAAVDAFASDSIFRCTADGRTVLTDRPTDTMNCQPLNAPTSNTFTSEPVSRSVGKVEPAPRPRTVERDSIAAEELKAKQRCERLDQRLDQVADKMRSGYTVRQGEKLRVQKEQLEASRRIERCS